MNFGNSVMVSFEFLKILHRNRCHFHENYSTLKCCAPNVSCCQIPRILITHEAKLMKSFTCKMCATQVISQRFQTKDKCPTIFRTSEIHLKWWADAEKHKVNGTISRVNIAWERIKVLSILGVTIKRSSENSKMQVMQGILHKDCKFHDRVKRKSWKIFDGFSIGDRFIFKIAHNFYFFILGVN